MLVNVEITQEILDAPQSNCSSNDDNECYVAQAVKKWIRPGFRVSACDEIYLFKSDDGDMEEIVYYLQGPGLEDQWAWQMQILNNGKAPSTISFELDIPEEYLRMDSDV